MAGCSSKFSVSGLLFCLCRFSSLPGAVLASAEAWVRPGFLSYGGGDVCSFSGFLGGRGCINTYQNENATKTQWYTISAKQPGLALASLSEGMAKRLILLLTPEDPTGKAIHFPSSSIKCRPK